MSSAAQDYEPYFSANKSPHGQPHAHTRTWQVVNTVHYPNGHKITAVENVINRRVRDPVIDGKYYTRSTRSYECDDDAGMPKCYESIFQGMDNPTFITNPGNINFDGRFNMGFEWNAADSNMSRGPTYMGGTIQDIDVPLTPLTQVESHNPNTDQMQDSGHKWQNEYVTMPNATYSNLHMFSNEGTTQPSHETLNYSHNTDQALPSWSDYQGNWQSQHSTSPDLVTNNSFTELQCKRLIDTGNISYGIHLEVDNTQAGEKDADTSNGWGNISDGNSTSSATSSSHADSIYSESADSEDGESSVFSDESGGSEISSSESSTDNDMADPGRDDESDNVSASSPRSSSHDDHDGEIQPSTPGSLFLTNRHESFHSGALSYANVESGGEFTSYLSDFGNTDMDKCEGNSTGTATLKPIYFPNEHVGNAESNLPKSMYTVMSHDASQLSIGHFESNKKHDNHNHEYRDYTIPLTPIPCSTEDPWLANYYESPSVGISWSPYQCTD